MKLFAAVRPEEESLLRVEKLAEGGDLWQFQVRATVRGKAVAEGQIVLTLATTSSFPAKLE
jgi:3-hydroxymyristoyl/3-hydroxydecanoyl-(acyl carrier protein) dehydratase